MDYAALTNETINTNPHTNVSFLQRDLVNRVRALVPQNHIRTTVAWSMASLRRHLKQYTGCGTLKMGQAYARASAMHFRSYDPVTLKAWLGSLKPRPVGQVTLVGLRKVR